MNGTLKAVLGCGLTLLLLGGFVTYLETRLPSEVKRHCLEERELLGEATHKVKTLEQQVEKELKAHGDVLGETAKSERWLELIHLAKEDLERAKRDYADKVQPLIDKNSREDEDAVDALLDELFKTRDEAMNSVAHLGPRVKEVAEILPRAAKRYAAVGEAIKRAETRVVGLEAYVENIARQEPETKPIIEREQWVSHLTAHVTTFKGLRQRHQALKATLDKNTVEAAKEALKGSEVLDAERSKAAAHAERVGKRVQALKTFLEKRAGYTKQVAADLKVLEGLPFAKFKTQREELEQRYPFNASEIKRRVLAFERLEQTSIQAAKRAQAQLKLPLSKADPARIMRDVAHVHKRRSEAPKVVQALQKQLSTLDRSYEKVLIDMQVKEGYEVTFRQQFLEVTAQRGVDRVEAKRSWVNVKAPDYKKLEPWLGMTVATKPYGYFKDQTERLPAAPAGMSYVGNPAYGAWKGDVWVFKDDAQTKVLVASAWGTHYPAHTRQDLTQFSHRRAAWKGRDRWGHDRYGSKGSLTALIFASSLYVRHKGWVHTKWKKSGGRYRGTRYEPKRSTTVFAGGSRSSGSSRRYRRTSYGK
jgi:hypothetical protein